MKSPVGFKLRSVTYEPNLPVERRRSCQKLLLTAMTIFGSLLSDQMLLADVLVLTTGRRWEGTVTETETGYIVEREGTKMTFPKSKVAEVISGSQKLKEFNQKLPMADLKNDRHIDYLVKLTNDAGLTDQRDELLKKTFQVRLKDAWDSTEQLNTLALWCDKHEFKEGSESIAARLLQLEYAERRQAVENDAEGLIKLVAWCEEKGLQAEAADSKRKALDLAPNDREIRKKLGYGWDEKGQRWVELPALWQGKVISATVSSSYQESSGIDTLTKSPSNGNSGVLIVDVEFQTQTAEEGKLADRPWAKGQLGELMTNILLGKPVKSTGKDINGMINGTLNDGKNLGRLAKPSRLLNSNDVKLILPGGKMLSAEFTSSPPGPGVSLIDTQITIAFDTDKNSAVLRYVRSVSGTIVLVQPKMPVTLKFIFSIPNKLEAAKLQFPASQPIEFTCETER